MEAIVERCCGLDVHQETVTACILTGVAGGKAKKQIRKFGTFTRQLEELREWIRSEGCTHVAMESTGSYWIPVYAVLETAERFELIVGNAHHMKNVPGRKTDVKDAEWIAELARHGLIRKSLVPPKPLRDLRDLLRYRRGLVVAQTTERNRLLRLLETANIKLASVASDVFCVSGMLMLRAMVDGKESPEAMAQLAQRRLRSKIPQLVEAMTGRLDDHHRFMLELQLRRLDNLNADIEGLDKEIDKRLEPYRAQHTLLMQIPGVDRVVAAIIIAELGVDMTVFPSEKHASAWAGVCPGNNESAGKHRPESSRRGNVHLQSTLVQAAVSAAHTRGSYFRDKFFRLRARRGAKRAQMAIAHKILIAAYHMLSNGSSFRELGATYLDEQDKERVAGGLIRRLANLGFDVAVRPKEQALST